MHHHCQIPSSYLLMIIPVFLSGDGQENLVPVLASEYKWGAEHMPTYFRKLFFYHCHGLCFCGRVKD